MMFLAHKLRLSQPIQLILLFVQLSVRDPEQRTADRRQDGDDAVVPDEEGIVGEGDKGLGDGGGDGGHEEEDGGDQGAHVLGGFGESVLEAGD